MAQHATPARPSLLRSQVLIHRFRFLQVSPPPPPQRRVSFCLSSNSTYHAGRGEGIELLCLPPSLPTPTLRSSPSPFSVPDPPLRAISFPLITIARAIPLIVLVPPLPRRPSSTHAYRHPSLLPSVIVIPSVACSMPAALLDFCCESPFDLCTYVALSISLSRSRPSRLASSPTLRMQCHISFVTQRNKYPFCIL